MKFFADTAEIAEIRELAATGLLDGVTTNPSLIAKSGRNFIETVREICELVEGPVSAEVAALDEETMLAEAASLPPSPKTWRSRCRLPGPGSRPAGRFRKTASW